MNRDAHILAAFTTDDSPCQFCAADRGHFTRPAPIAPPVAALSSRRLTALKETPAFTPTRAHCRMDLSMPKVPVGSSARSAHSRWWLPIFAARKLYSPILTRTGPCTGIVAGTPPLCGPTCATQLRAERHRNYRAVPGQRRRRPRCSRRPRAEISHRDGLSFQFSEATEYRDKRRAVGR